MQFDHVALQVPDIADALAWWQETVPVATVLYQDETWGLLEAGGCRLAFVMADQHPNHLGFKVSAAQLERLAAAGDAPIASHRDGSRSFYTAAPGDHRIELIAYPDLVGEDDE
ncbi:MAG: VOC family protein [Actinomycetota bacterium]|nr:VOC family protein [Actinomycetota bacterium]